MTRHKDTPFRRVIIDLSWPHGYSVNDGISRTEYIDGPMMISLSTPDDMERAVVRAGRGSFLYKTDLSRGYRQLRVDLLDWPYLSFRHGSHCFMDICPPFGLRSSTMAMQRVSEAIVHLHGRRGYLSRAYIDDYGGVEGTEHKAGEALSALQTIMDDLGMVQASLEFKQDVQFFLDLLPIFNGRRMMGKQLLPYQHQVELDACLTGCGAVAGDQYYATQFPKEVRDLGHTIANLELLNIVIAIKVWATKWSGWTVQIYCDNMNSVCVPQSGRLQDVFMRACAREIFL